MNSSAPAMSHALDELVGHVDRLQRSLLFTHFRLEQGPISVYIADSRRARQGTKPTYSCRKTRSFYRSFKDPE
jgi:hypothetical protein